MNQVVDRAEAVRPLGVIDTLTAGYELINRRLWLVLLPVALDLLFWFGPKLSVVRLMGYVPLDTLGWTQVAGASEALAHLNLVCLLALYVPTVLGQAVFDPVVPARGWEHRVVYQVVPETFVVAVAVLIPLALLINALYFGQIGQLVRPAAGAGSSWLRSLGRHWWRLVVLHVAGLLVFVCLAAPAALLFAATTALVSREVAGFLLLLFQVTLLWLVFYFFFALAATILSDGSAVRAALSSIDVVRMHFWPAVGLIGLTLVINTGLSLVWRALAGQTDGPLGPLSASWGLVASIVANAYVGTGLAAAGMVFYRDRLPELA